MKKQKKTLQFRAEMKLNLIINIVTLRALQLDKTCFPSSDGAACSMAEKINHKCRDNSNKQVQFGRASNQRRDCITAYICICSLKCLQSPKVFDKKHAKWEHPTATP